MERWKMAGAVLLVVAAFAMLLISGGQQNAAESPDAKLLTGSDVHPAVDFSLPNAATGQHVSLLAEAKKQPVVINFWATWCAPCREELPHLQKLSQLYHGRVQFYGINSSDSPKNIVEFAKENGLTFPMLSDARHDAAVRYGVNSIPRLLVIDTHGDVRSVTEGYDSDIDKDLPRILDALLAGR